MTTLKKRVNLSLPEVMEKTLKHLAERDAMPMATKAVELLRIALEIEEDAIYSQIAHNRLKTRKKTLTHKEIWD